MRTLGRFFVIGLVLLSGFKAGSAIWESLDWGHLANYSDERIRSARVGLAYELAAQPWLAFHLSKQANAILVRSNGIVASQADTGDDTVWTYAFDFELLGERDQIIDEGRYFHRTRVSRYRDPLTGAEQQRSFLLEPDLLPVDSRTMRLDFANETHATKLRLRPAELDPALSSVAFRVYQRLPNAAHRLGYLWQRLGPPQRDRLARGSVYGPDLLRGEEKANLLRHSWKAVGPQGVEGEHYASRKIYGARETVGERIETGLLPDGLYIDADTHGMVPLPEGSWQVSLSFQALENGSPADPDDTVTVRWHGRGLDKRWQAAIAPDGGEQSLGPAFDGGLLELVSSRAFVVRAAAESGTTRLDVTPEPTRLPSYTTAHSRAIDFGVDHVGEQSTPIRIDVRGRIPRELDSMEARVEYALFAADGQSLQQADVNVELVASSYDRLAQNDPRTRLSDPVRLYFRLPPNVQRIQLSSDQELLVSGYSRPPDLTRLVRVPEDYRTFENAEGRQPAWFLLRPDEAERLRREMRAFGLLLQKRPPRTDPLLVAGVYDWESYQPEGNWKGRYLMLPRESAFPVRDQALAAVYRELPRGRPVSLRLSGGIGRRQVSPTLVFLRSEKTPAEIELLVDGTSHLRTKIAGSQGELRLPPLRPGRREILLRFDAAGRFYLNHAGASGESYLRRLALRLDGDGLDFDYEKRSDEAEVLTAEFFTESGTRSVLEVTVGRDHEPRLSAASDWTFRNRVYDVAPGTNALVPVLNTAGHAVDGGRKFWLPLGADLPAGHYRVSIRPTNGTQGYLVLYRLVPGQQVSRLFFRESLHAD